MVRAFEVVTGNRLELLLEQLAERLRAAPLRPLQSETIVVSGQGMARWVTLQLARRLGIAASLELPFPGAFVQSLCQRARAGADVEALFGGPVLTLRLFRLLGDHRLLADLGPAAAYVADDPDQHKRMQLAERLASTFDDYQLYRDDALLAFERDRADGSPHARWQARLWQQLVREVGGAAESKPTAAGQRLLFAAAPPPASAHRLERVRQLLADEKSAARVLPPRLSVFGLAALPPAFLDLLLRIADHREVVVYAPKPTPHWFGDQTKRRGTRPGTEGPPLLAALGRQSREFFDLLLDRTGDLDVERPDAFLDPGTDTLLHTLQHDLLHLADRGRDADAPRLPLAAADDSLLLHSAHGPLREFEIVRDRILDAMARDRTLQPSDVMVLVPDVQQYAPYAHAVFGPHRRLLPFHVADRSPAAELPLASTFLRLCALAQSRFSAPEVLLLLEEPGLARRFAIARTDLTVLRRWVQRTRIRWGVDGAQRADLGLPEFEANSFAHGLDRLLLGVCTGPVDEPLDAMLPVADGTSTRAELLGRFVAFVDAVAATCRLLSRPHTLSSWADIVETAAANLFEPLADDEQQGLAHLQDVAKTLRQQKDLARLNEELAPTTFARWFEAELGRRSDGRGFLRGTVTIAALRPLRAVPVRMLCVVGLADGSFPRRDQRPAFDLLAQERLPGDRSARDDDRQAFLDLLLATKDRLVLTWIGRSQKDNSPCMPSPVLTELLDWTERAFTPPPGFDSMRSALVVDHPLQAFSPRYGATDDRLFTYAAAAKSTATTPAAATAPPARAVARDDQGREIVELDELLAFWRHPTRWYCREVLQLRFKSEDDRDDDSEPFALDSLDRYLLLEQAAEAAVLGRPDPIARGDARGTGALPPGALGALADQDLAHNSAAFAATVAREHGKGEAPVIVVGQDYVVRGELHGLRPDAMVLWRATTVKEKDQLRAFILHAVKTLAIEQGADLPEATLLFGSDQCVRAEPCSPATSHVDVLVAGFRRGRERPLPFFEHASCAFATEDDRDTAQKRARSAYEPDDQQPYRHDLPDPDIEFCFPQSPLQSDEFVHWAVNVFQPASTFFRRRADK